MLTTPDPINLSIGTSPPVSKPSPGRYLITLALLIFLAEIASMLILYALQIPNYAITSLLDGIMVLALITPGLFFLQLRPMLKNAIAERRQRELAEGLVQATIVLNTSLELDQVLHTILEQIRKAFPFQGANIILLENETLQVASFIGYEDHPNSMEESYSMDDYPLLRQVYLSHQPIVIDSVSDHSSWRARPGQEWIRSYAAIPLVVDNEVVGIINLHSEHTRQFSGNTVQRLLAFTAPAALALYNARLYKAESTARQFAETLSAAAQALSQNLNLKHVLNTLLDHLYIILPSDSAGVTLLEDKTHPIMHTLRGYGKWAGCTAVPSVTAEVNSRAYSIIRQLESTRKSLEITNPIPRPSQTDQISQIHIHSWLVIPLMANDKVIGWAELGKTETGTFNPEYTQWVEALALQAGVAVQNAWLFEQVRSSHKRMQALARKLVKIQENERYHIARELHDEAGQALSSLKIKLRLLEQDPNCPPSAQKKLAEMKDTTDIVLEELHRMAMNLRPATLDQLGLVAALEQHVNHLNAEKIAIQFKAVGFEGIRLAQDVETSLYRIVQEALTNVIRHAQAHTVGILLERIGDSIKLFVEDDGIGLSLNAIQRKEQLGLVGMRERAEMMGGNLTIESAAGTGTTIIVEVPDVCTDSNRG